jgi:hypothetical protein
MTKFQKFLLDHKACYDALRFVSRRKGNFMRSFEAASKDHSEWIHWLYVAMRRSPKIPPCHCNEDGGYSTCLRAKWEYFGNNVATVTKRNYILREALKRGWRK